MSSVMLLFMKVTLLVLHYKSGMNIRYIFKLISNLVHNENKTKNLILLIIPSGSSNVIYLCTIGCIKIKLLILHLLFNYVIFHYLIMQ